MIYSKPETFEKPIGVAELCYKIGKKRCKEGLEFWQVKFDNGSRGDHSISSSTEVNIF